MKSVKCNDPAQLESHISAVEDAIKDWRRHKRDKEELQKELASCKDTIKTMEFELSLERRKLADANTVINTIQENMQFLLCKSSLFQEVIGLCSSVASNLAPAIPAYMNGYSKAPPALTAGHQWMLIHVQESLRQSN